MVETSIALPSTSTSTLQKLGCVENFMFDDAKFSERDDDDDDDGGMQRMKGLKESLRSGSDRSTLNHYSCNFNLKDESCFYCEGN